MMYTHMPRLARAAIVRERLLRRMGQSAAVTVVTGPPGMGKTTLAAHWARSQEHAGSHIVWLSLDTTIDPDEFWRGVGAAFATALGSTGDEEFSGTPYEVAAMLEMATRPVAWVIDGLQQPTAQSLVDDVLALVSHTPGLRLLVCFDSPPPSMLPPGLNLDTMVLAADELAFTRDETARLLSELGLRLPDGLAGALHADVDGWPLLVAASALLLPHEDATAGAIRRATRQAASQFVEHYLDRLGPSQARMTDFLLHSSVADRFTSAMAEVLTGVADAHEYLEPLAFTGLLTRSALNGEPVFVFPTAIRDALRDTLRRSQPERYQQLLEKLVVWYLRQGADCAMDALQSALRSGDNELVVEVVEEQWPALYRENGQLLTTTLDSLQPETVASSPSLTSARAVLLGSHSPAMEDGVPEDPQVLDSLGSGQDAAEFLSRSMAVCVAARRQGNIAHASGVFDRLTLAADAARRHRNPSALRDLPVVYLQAGLTFLLGGQLPRAQELLQHAYELRVYHRGGHIGYDAATKLALTLCMKGDIHAATRWLHRARECEHQRGPNSEWGVPYIQSTRHIANALLLLEEGRFAEAATELDYRCDVLRDEFRPLAFIAHAQHGLHTATSRHVLDEWDALWRTHASYLPTTEAAMAMVTASYADVLMAAGQGTRAGALLAACDSMTPELHISAARWALLTGDIEGVLERVSTMLWEFGTHKRTRVHLQLIYAAALEHNERYDEADSLLSRAVALARRNGMLTPFAAADQGFLERRARVVDSLPALLVDLDSRGFAPIFPDRLEVIPLSDREQAVLQALDTGEPVDKIARTLFVSANTVKTQMKSLYAKLRTHTRAETLLKAREHGLLASQAHSSAGLASPDGSAPSAASTQQFDLATAHHEPSRPAARRSSSDLAHPRKRRFA